MKKHLIVEVLENSIGSEVGIERGDFLCSINDVEIGDALDYHLHINEEEIEVLILKGTTGEEWLIEIEKEEDEDLGLVFKSDLMDEYKSCYNKCIFCFIDQLPKGMRETMYFKDDDARLSFLQGNYVTFTNMKDNDIERIIKYHLSPINISVHTMDLELRKKMLNNKFADRIKGYMDKLYDAGITMNGQIVLCKGINDGETLDYTIEALTSYIPHMQSVSVVPVGLSKYRKGLYPLEPFTKEDAILVLDTTRKWQNRLYKHHKTHFIHAGDEFYFLADRNVPEEKTYDDYLQLENGVGMTRLLIDEFNEWYNKLDIIKVERNVSIVTGVLSAPIIKNMVSKLQKKCININIKVYPIINYFFGERITVSGLLTGQDIINQLKDKDLGDKLILPSNLLKNEEDILLDDMTVNDIRKALNIEVEIVNINGKAFIETLLDEI